MPTMTIDGIEYNTDDFSDEAKRQLAMIQFVDRKLIELQSEIAVCQTARNAYGKALSELLLAPKVEQH